VNGLFHAGASKDGNHLHRRRSNVLKLKLVL
jgi:hypothetical protein